MKIYISNRKNINRLIATKFLAIFMMIYFSSEVSGKTSTLFEKTPFDKVEGNTMLGLLSLLGFGDKSKKQYVTTGVFQGSCRV